MRLPRRWSIAVSVCLPFMAFPQAANVPMKTYTDPASGVSFTYPAAWTLSRTTAFYLGSLVTLPDPLARAVVSFSSRDNYYAKTNLDGLEFTFVAVPEASPETCSQRIGREIDPAGKRAETLTINGRRFLHLAAGDTGMCHGANRDIYQTYSEGSCYLFEADMHTVCADVDAGRRELTAGETKALHRHLDSIMQTVQIKPGM